MKSDGAEGVGCVLPIARVANIGEGALGELWAGAHDLESESIHGQIERQPISIGEIDDPKKKSLSVEGVAWTTCDTISYPSHMSLARGFVPHCPTLLRGNVGQCGAMLLGAGLHETFGNKGERFFIL